VGKVEKECGNGKYLVLLDNWALAQGQSPSCYLNMEAMEPYKSPVGTVVSTFMGPCKLLEIRNGMTYVVEPTSWKLADYSSTQVKGFLNKESIKFMDSANVADACC
jgi:hypothetical protein